MIDPDLDNQKEVTLRRLSDALPQNVLHDLFSMRVLPLLCTEVFLFFLQVVLF